MGGRGAGLGLEGGPQQLAEGGSRLAARHHSESPARAHLLYDAGKNRATHVSDFHQPEGAAALQLSALPRKPAARQIRLRWHAGPFYPALAQTRETLWWRRRP